MPPEQPRGRIALTGVMLAFSRHRGGAARRRYAVIGVIGKCCRMHIDGGGGHESMFVHQTDAIIVGSAPNTGVGRHGQVKVTRNLERGLLGEGRVAGNVEGKLHAQHISTSVNATSNEVGKLRGLCPLPGSAEQVAVSEDEPTRNRFKRVDCRIGVFDRLQAMRPVDRCGDASVYGLNRGQEIAGINILRTEDLAPVQVVELEIVREGPVGTEPTECCLPHVAVRVNPARHENAVGRVDLYRAIRYDELSSNSRDAVVDDEGIAALDHPKRWVDGQHGGVTEYHRASW